jgi:hypothetical protein
MAVLMASLGTATATAIAFEQTGAGAVASGTSSVGALRPVACKAMPSDPPLEAPLYAQNAGARGGNDGWWCQLPHASQIPGSFVAIQRVVVPLPNLYGLYATTYAPAAATTESASQLASRASIVVAPRVNGAVNPGTIERLPPPSGGRTVTLAKGVTATVVAKGRSVVVTWPYPSSKTPPYLRAVASVTVTGTGVPESVVVAVAKHVEPD